MDAAGGIQWPRAKDAIDAATERRLFESGEYYHPDRKARFIFDRPQEPPDQSNLPFILLTGRGSSAQWHTLTRTGKSPVLRQLSRAEPYLEINPADAGRLGIVNGRKLRVTTERASIVAQAFITGAVAPGQVFMPMHSELTNQLTFPSVDPHSRQPSYKFTRVQLTPVRNDG